MSMATVRLTQLDGKLPNLALLKLAHWHRAQGDRVVLSMTLAKSMMEPSHYDVVYGSAIFQWSKPLVHQLQAAFPEAVVGGTGSGSNRTVEEVIGTEEYEQYDYSVYPHYPWSIGFTQRGCRLRCGFCVVPAKEGRPRAVNTIRDIWRPGTERCLVLLDNDFFGQPEDQWRARIDEMNGGRFKVNFNQGINVRLLTRESAEALASLKYYDAAFRRRQLYTAWDNLGQEGVFFKGLGLLQDAGIPARHVTVYMLVGYKPGETMDEVMYRYRRLKDAGCLPYPMVYDRDNRLLKAFQRWVVRRYDQFVPWEQYLTGPRGRQQMESLRLL